MPITGSLSEDDTSVNWVFQAFQERSWNTWNTPNTSQMSQIHGRGIEHATKGFHSQNQLPEWHQTMTKKRARWAREYLR